MSKNIIVLFFAINGLFWALASHSQHCSIAAMVGISSCPPHYIHLIMGIISFIIAIYIQQRDYINTLFKI
jgi:hypothetical protein|tara:strand:- start:314 stop:523 length:210 start_codon:yes stop_codon:yes gene_type:complete